jgi:hypothetical protein
MIYRFACRKEDAMLESDPRCVYVADTLMEAELAASWLDQQGIVSEVMNQSGMGGLPSWASRGASSRGLEIWVKNAVDAAKARELLEQHEELRAARAARANTQGSLLVTCEDCGEACSFPASARGSVQHCPHCDSYLDVEPAGSSDDMDYGTEDEAIDDEEEPGPPPGPDTRIEPA